MKLSILNLSSILIFLLMFGLISCQKDEESVIPAEKYFSKFKGAVHSYFNYADSTSVTIENGNFKRKTQTSESGQFTFDSLETGTYNLTFEKEGYGTNKVFGVRHYGFPSDTLIKVYASLYKKAKSTVDKTGIVFHEKTDYFYNVLRLEVEISNNQYNEETVIAFVSRKPDVSKDAYDFYLTKEYSSFWLNNNNENVYKGITLSYSEIARKGYKNGDKLYFKFYTVNRLDNGYSDYKLERQVFPTISSNQLPAVEHILSL